MEAAGALAAREINQSYLVALQDRPVAVLAGGGGNGADGLVVARHLRALGCRFVSVFLCASDEDRSALFTRQLRRLQQVSQATSHGPHLKIHDFYKGGEPVDVATRKKFYAAIRSSPMRVDAIFGVGLKRDLTGLASEVVGAINHGAGSIVSLDVPSGLCADRGRVLGAAVRATMTLSFVLPKLGFYLNEGPAHCGKVRVLAIGIAPELVAREARTHFLFGEDLAKQLKPKRSQVGNKTSFGHTVVFAGSAGMYGAGFLASAAAYRIGAGYVTLASLDHAAPIPSDAPEVLTASAEGKELWNQPKWTTAAIGPGLIGRFSANASQTGDEVSDDHTADAVRLILRLKSLTESGHMQSVVVDADALTVAAKHQLFPFPASWIITPHAGELARIFASVKLEQRQQSQVVITAADIEADRGKYVLLASSICGCHIVLKGFRTLVTNGKRVAVIHAGNVALAKAGTGDVLTGFISGLLAQGLKPFQAAALGAYVHGRLADDWLSDGNDGASLLASDLYKRLPPLLARL